MNPLVANAHAEAGGFCTEGVSDENAAWQSTFRIFSSKPGAYGAGLQALIDENLGSTAQILRRRFWSGRLMLWRKYRR